jgi:NADH dehydrogenase [ubiquinone] 1 alpha subcomplex assembly factor 3
MPPPIRLLAPRSSRLALRALTSLPTTTSRLSLPVHDNALLPRPLHTNTPLSRTAHNNEQIPDQPPPTDFARMDVLGQTPPPATSIDACLPDGFVLGDSAVTISGGSGALLVGGEAFVWRPWDSNTKQLVNGKGQWEVQGLDRAFGLLGVVWPRPGRLLCPNVH